MGSRPVSVGRSLPRCCIRHELYAPAFLLVLRRSRSRRRYGPATEDVAAVVNTWCISLVTVSLFIQICLLK
ncbi:unnamed protein product [Acanthoscelides obtectus]|uniref:Uncharacterized protein n=1 Tax=Acanthoscelides obtectus TaxID=200917 RepID=A0A9P0LZA9_ACAOB|nr:unnamed protein product [Acanthoscelides obtectus]CAK1688849.1 hypothetical protein AOBTE_LOCUS36922 [Acanthoscelides obtectus]